MSFFVEMNRDLTSALLCTHSSFVVAKSDLKFVGCRCYTLNITFVTSDQVDHVLRFAMEMLCNLIDSIGTSASEVIGFY